jgi:dihydroorotase
MPLSQIVACASVNASTRLMTPDMLRVRAPVDVATIELPESSLEFVGNYKGTRSGQQRLFPITTVLAGTRTTWRA